MQGCRRGLVVSGSFINIPLEEGAEAIAGKSAVILVVIIVVVVLIKWPTWRKEGRISQHA